METYKVMGLELTVPEGKSNEIEKTFKPFDIALKGHNEEFNNIISSDITPELCKKAGDLRKKLVKVRTGSEKARKELKGDVLQLSKAIDAVGNFVKDSVSEKETKLKEIETHFERIEAEKKEALKSERMAELAKFDIDGSGFGLENMDETVWDSFRASQEATYKAKKQAEKDALIARLKAEKEKELHEERKNKLLQYWNFLEESEKILNFGTIEEDEFRLIINAATNKKALYDKEQAEIKAENDKLRAEQAEKDRLAKIEADKKAEELARERKEKEEAERLLREKEEAERAKMARIKAEELAKQQAPDKEKLKSYFNDLLSIHQPNFDNQKFADLGILFKTKLESLINSFQDKL